MKNTEESWIIPSRKHCVFHAVSTIIENTSKVKKSMIDMLKNIWGLNHHNYIQNITHLTARLSFQNLVFGFVKVLRVFVRTSCDVKTMSGSHGSILCGKCSMQDMPMSWSGNDFRITGLCEWNPSVPDGRFQTQMASFLYFGFDSLVNKLYQGTADRKW